MGEICNACVLIVKRWRQLPLGTSKNWAHVVDARAGSGHNTKKMMVPVVLKPSVKKRPIEEEEEAVEQGGGSSGEDRAHEGEEEKSGGGEKASGGRAEVDQQLHIRFHRLWLLAKNGQLLRAGVRGSAGRGDVGAEQILALRRPQPQPRLSRRDGGQGHSTQGPHRHKLRPHALFGAAGH